MAAEPGGGRRVVPAHRRADPIVRLRSGHPDLFAVVDERDAGSGQQQVGGDAQLAGVGPDLAGDAILIVIGEERTEPAARGIERRDPGEHPTEAVAVPRVRGTHVRAGEREVEGHVEVVRDVVGAHLWRVPDLADQERTGSRLLHRRAESPPPGVGLGRVLGGPSILDEVLRCVEPE